MLKNGEKYTLIPKYVRAVLCAKGRNSRAPDLRWRKGIEVTTLDRLLDSHPDLEGPLLLKVDTEGYQLDVICGGTAFLRRVDVHDFLLLSYRRDGAGTQMADIAFINRDRLG